MVKGLIGEKIEMTQVFDRHQRVVPVTKIQVAPNYVVAVKSVEKDGYKAVQIGAGVSKKASRPVSGLAKKADLKAVPKSIREVEFEGELKAGEEISLDQVFRVGQLADVSSVSKGKGFAGVVKRWGFAGGPRTHGQSDRERAPGSIGATTTPGRVYKGLKMAGHLGGRRVTVQGLEIIEIDKEKNELLIKGSVPGARGSLLLIQKSKKKKKTYREPEILEVPKIAGLKEEVMAEETGTGETAAVTQTPNHEEPAAEKTAEERQ
jgi:large subunit ribosomal protein L3